jgi:hypothetical protein
VPLLSPAVAEPWLAPVVILEEVPDSVAVAALVAVVEEELTPVVVAVVVFEAVSDFVAVAVPVVVVKEELTPVVVAVVDPMDVRLFEKRTVSEVLDSVDVVGLDSVVEWELVWVVVSVCDAVVCSGVNNAVDGTE